MKLKSRAKQLIYSFCNSLTHFCVYVFLSSDRLKEKLYNVLEAAGGGFWRDMEQATDDNQGRCDARLCGKSHVEWSLFVSYANLHQIEI